MRRLVFIVRDPRPAPVVVRRLKPVATRRPLVSEAARGSRKWWNERLVHCDESGNNRYCLLRRAARLQEIERIDHRLICRGEEGVVLAHRQGAFVAILGQRSQ